MIKNLQDFFFCELNLFERIFHGQLSYSLGLIGGG